MIGVAAASSFACIPNIVQHAEAMHDPEDPENSICQNDVYYLADPMVSLYYPSGMRLPYGGPLAIGTQVELNTFVKDACGHPHPALIGFEVRDPNDVTIYLALQQIDEMQAYTLSEFGVSWVAPEEPGTYEVRAFAFVDLRSSGFGRFASSQVEVVLPEE